MMMMYLLLYILITNAWKHATAYQADCKFGLSYHSISDITLNTKFIVFKICCAN